jgi:hypothetical protein
MTLLEQQIIDAIRAEIDWHEAESLRHREAMFEIMAEAEAEGTQPSDDFDIANLAARFCEIAADRLLAILAKTQA